MQRKSNRAETGISKDFRYTVSVFVNESRKNVCNAIMHSGKEAERIFYFRQHNCLNLVEEHLESSCNSLYLVDNKSREMLLCIKA